MLFWLFFGEKKESFPLEDAQGNADEECVSGICFKAMWREQRVRILGEDQGPTPACRSCSGHRVHLIIPFTPGYP